MQQPSILTIRELPKTKKTSVDELHPMLKVQKNVPIRIKIEIYPRRRREDERNCQFIWLSYGHDDQT